MNDRASIEFHTLNSGAMDAKVPLSVVLPPGYDQQKQALPLLISLHGGGADRTMLTDEISLWQELWESELIPPMVMISFSSGPGSWYFGAWETFVTDELPAWASGQYGVSTLPNQTLLTGVSMGGYGALKIALKNPNRFKAVAAMEPAIEPSIGRMAGGKRNTWWRMPAIEAAVWGQPVNEELWVDNNPATIAHRNAEEIRESNLDIYLEVGDQDYINLHDGAEFMHRVLWDHDIRHEYHLVRWADHVGKSMPRRFRETFMFLAASLSGGLEEPTDLPLTEQESKYIEWIGSGGMMTGEPEPEGGLQNVSRERAPSVHRQIWQGLKELANDDPEMARSYARLAETSSA